MKHIRHNININLKVCTSLSAKEVKEEISKLFDLNCFEKSISVRDTEICECDDPTLKMIEEDCTNGYDIVLDRD